jgi:hypothetical protein
LLSFLFNIFIGYITLIRTSSIRNVTYAVCLFVLMICCSSCARIFFGMGKNKPLSNAAVEKYARRYGLPSSGILDSNYYRRAKALPEDKDVIKGLVQPLQFWLYNGDTLNFAMVNCYASYRFPNLVWSLDDVSTATSPMDVRKFLSYQEHATLLGDVSSVDKKAKLIVVWSKFLGRQDRHFLREVHRYLKKNPSVEATFYNADNMYN